MRQEIYLHDQLTHQSNIFLSNTALQSVLLTVEEAKLMSPTTTNAVSNTKGFMMIESKG